MKSNFVAKRKRERDKREGERERERERERAIFISFFEKLSFEQR
jgi:tmRNA-binding protein